MLVKVSRDITTKGVPDGDYTIWLEWLSVLGNGKIEVGKGMIVRP